MKLIMTAIAMLGAMTTFAGSALADVTISITFGPSPSTNTYRTYDSYNSNIRHHTYHNNSYHQNYNHHQNVDSGVMAIIGTIRRLREWSILLIFLRQINRSTTHITPTLVDIAATLQQIHR
jgi:hypothetical protein